MKYLLITIVLFFEVPLSQEDTEYGMNWSEILSKDYESIKWGEGLSEKYEMEKPKKNFYLSCNDGLGWFGGKYFSFIFYYDEKTEKLTEMRINKHLEKENKPAVNTIIIEEIERPLHSSNRDEYSFGVTIERELKHLTARELLNRFSGITLNRENLEIYFSQSLQINSEAISSIYCETINKKDHEKIFKSFKDRSDKFELKKNEYHKNKNQL